MRHRSRFPCELTTGPPELPGLSWPSKRTVGAERRDPTRVDGDIGIRTGRCASRSRESLSKREPEGCDRHRRDQVAVRAQLERLEPAGRSRSLRAQVDLLVDADDLRAILPLRRQADVHDEIDNVARVVDGILDDVGIGDEQP